MVGEITENNMADMGTLSADQAAQQQQILRQQRMAEMLLQQGMQQPQGQMISGHYVAPSITQNLANLANVYMGQRGIEKADKAQIDLANRLRQQGVQESQDIISLMRGRQATPEVVPQGQTLRDDQGMLTMGSQRGVAGVAPDLEGAYAKAVGSTSPQALALAPMLAKQLMREPNYKEVNIVNQKTGDTETYRYDANAADPTKTYQLLGINKPALSPADKIRFADEGININVGGANAPAVSNQPANLTGGQANPQSATQVNSPVIKPINATKNDEFVKVFGYDPFVAPPPPPSITSGKDLRNYKLDQAKPLTGTAADQVTGAKLYTDSLIKYNDYVNSLTPSDLLNPSVRVKLTSLHSQAKLAGKEANKLGVLNGGDERILEEVLPNYKDITVTKKNLNNLIQGQKEFGTSVIVNAYGTQQKAVPENMRKYVVVPKEIGAETKPKPSTTTQRAVLNGENIVVKNGKWVYERTGKAVE
jgi:hypothetical protein